MNETAGIHIPDPRSPGVGAGITEAIIRDLVHAFYAKVRDDAVLGPIFAAEVQDWPSHLDKMCTFWSSVTLMTGLYKGRPMPVHARLPGIGSEHFARWLALFRETTAETCDAPAAAVFIDRAERIAQSLQAGIAIHRAALQHIEEEQAR